MLAEQSRSWVSPERLFDIRDNSPLFDHLAFGCRVSQCPRRRRVNLVRDLGDLYLGDEVPFLHGGAVVSEPGGDHALRIGCLLVHQGETYLGHRPSTSLIALVMRSGIGNTACSRSRAYGIGTSGTATRRTGARSIPGSDSATTAAISPDTPNA